MSKRRGEGSICLLNLVKSTLDDRGTLVFNEQTKNHSSDKAVTTQCG